MVAAFAAACLHHGNDGAMKAKVDVDACQFL